ncbi:MAG: amidohydrolase family protein [Actinobacteria bacterium]|nr:amidohydrolase family protein [Actinomycetota bacterium]
MEPSQPTAQAIAIKGEVIIGVGTDDEVIAMSGPETQIIDLHGQTVMPGFVDAHDHVFNDAAAQGLDLDQSQQQALENGITTLANMYTPPEFLDEMQAFERAGKLRIRTSLYLTYSGPCGDVLGDWYKDVAPTRNPGEMLRIGGIKVFTDGGVCGKYALSIEYPDGGYGDLWFAQDELNKIVADADGAGYQVVLHAIGDRAIESAMDAIESALDGGPNVLRHRIDHNSFARPDLLPRYSEIGIVPIAFGFFPTCQEVDTGIYSSTFAAELPWFENWRAFLDATPGLPVAWHSDWPYLPLNPFEHLYSYVTRQGVDDDGVICPPPAWLAAQRITVDEALSMMTINAAYALFRETEVGSLKAGKFADLLVLSADPRTVDPDDLIDIEVWMTMVGGNVEYRAAGHESLSPSTASSDGEPASITATASKSIPDSPPLNAVDGDSETIWSSGDDPPQWIQVDLGEPIAVSAIRLVLAQYPAGRTVHQIWGGREEDSLTLLEEFSGSTEDMGRVEFDPATPLADIRYVKIITTVSPSWVAWREIEVMGRE